MDLLSAALLALSAEPTLPALAVHYEQLGDGWVRSRFVREGMTVSEVRAIMVGREDNNVFGTCFYYHCCVIVACPLGYAGEHRVISSAWNPRWAPH
jgi:hypothetical protein